MPHADAPGRFAFRWLDESDLPLLHRWLNAPHVLEWWDRPGPTPDEVRAKYLPRVTGMHDVTPYIICLGEIPLGYIQLYPIRHGTWGRHDPGSSAGLDLFIGDSRYLRRGLGPRILRQFLEEIVFRDEAVNACFIDPSPRNRIAIRAFEKAGFRSVGIGTDPDSGLEVHLMRITRHDFESDP
jgi:RimJ/RimL family protein N-acetyltransferase